jgi:DNA-binding winged helix-turn-helix (wHTH) protein/Flp pilus assembly protein TadD
MVKFDSFILDVPAQRLTRDGVVVNLTPKAFDVLRVLVDAGGRVVSKDELLQTVWKDSFVEEGNLKVTVSVLRKALGDGERFIETVPRRGYRFAAAEDERSGAVRPAMGPARAAALVATVAIGLAFTQIVASRSHDCVECKYTSNVKAFHAYMEGQAYVHRRTREDLLKAARMYERAIQEDSGYALAYAGLADVYGNLGVRGYISPLEGRRKSAEAARRAIELDDRLAEAHTALGTALVAFAPYETAAGERELKRAIELNPSYALSHLYMALSLMHRSEFDAALREILTAHELDPLSTVIAKQVSLPYQMKRDVPRAVLALQAAEGAAAFSTSSEVGVYLLSGRYEEALEQLERAAGERRNDPLLIFSAGLVRAAMGDRSGALAAIRELQSLPGDPVWQAHGIAKVHAKLGDVDAALSWLERGLDTGAMGAFYPAEAVWDAIRDDARFDAVVRRAGITGN